MQSNLATKTPKAKRETSRALAAPRMKRTFSVARRIGTADVTMIGPVLIRDGTPRPVVLTRKGEKIAGAILASGEMIVWAGHLYSREPGTAWHGLYRPHDKTQTATRQRAIRRVNDAIFPLGLEIADAGDDRLTLRAFK